MRSVSSTLILFQHTNTHTNKAAEAARRELIRVDRTQWHPWHFREKACRFKTPGGCVVRILQTEKSLREWMAKGWRGGGKWRIRQQPGSQDIYLVRHAIRGHLSFTFAAVKLCKMRRDLPVDPKEKQTSEWTGRRGLGVGILREKLMQWLKPGDISTSQPSAEGLVQQQLNKGFSRVFATRGGYICKFTPIPPR